MLVSWVAPAALLLMMTSASPAAAQSPCAGEPAEIPVVRRPITLTPEQEQHLGDAVAEHLERAYRVVHDDANEHLQAIGDRLVEVLQPTGLAFRFQLVDQPHVNAFALPGGRVYVTRKLVAASRSEDELAGVLAHEVGHIVTREIAADLSAAFKQAIKVTAFGDRRDVFEKYRQLVDSRRTFPRADRQAERGQHDADRVALLATARAGYDPSAYIAFWDRIAETRGRTGNFFTNLFGATPPEARRLREMLRDVEKLEVCERPRVSDAAAYEEWRQRVIAARRSAGPEALRAVIVDRPLEPPLRDDLEQLRFSPDGRHVLAQDESSVYVIGREPFAVRFRIDATGAQPAQFTPDGRTLLFHTRTLRVERWDVETSTRAAVHEVVSRTQCLQTALSPDGRVIACLDLEFALVLFDVAGGDVVFRREQVIPRNYVIPSWLIAAHELEIFSWNLVELVFSPDGQYLIAGGDRGLAVVDVPARRDAKLPDAIRRAFRRRFAFLGGDRLLVADPERPERSAILRFPTGELLKSVTLGGRVSAATRGDFAMLRPIRDFPVGLVDLSQDRIVMAGRASALDVYDELQVSELPNGDVGLFESGSRTPLASAALPRAFLGWVEASDVSADLKWLALSGRRRGGVWNAETGARVMHVAGFKGVDIDERTGVVYADFPARSHIQNGRLVDRPRAIVRLELGSASTRDHAAPAVGATVQWGRVLATLTPARVDRPDENVTLDVRDVRTDAALWQRRFPREAPFRLPDLANRRLILAWPASTTAARDAIRSDPRLREQASARGIKGGDLYFEVVDLESGEPIGALLVSTGRDDTYIIAAGSSGDTVVLTDSHNQVVVYTLSTGDRRGAAFGRLAAVSEHAGLLCVQNDSGQLQVHDLTTVDPVDEVRFTHPVRLARFSPDGSRLLVVTADQIVRVMDTAQLGSDEKE